ncbi:MAG: peptidase S11, partial [Limnohabitans sp.]
MKNIRYSLIVSALALGLAGFSNASLARMHTVGAKKQTAKSVSVRKKSSLRAKAVQPKRPSFGEKAGLHAQSDELSLKSSVAYVIDQDTQQELLSKNDNAVLPIASITKLMT